MQQTLADILLRALNENDIGSLIRNVSQHLECPVMVTDADFHLVACWPESSLGDPMWDAMLQYGTAPTEFINKMHIDGTLEYSASSSEPYVLDWGFLEEFPRALVNLERNHKFYGHLTVVTKDRSDALFESLKSIGSVLCILLEQQYMDGVMADDYQTIFMNYLLNASDIEQEELLKWGSNLKISLQPPYYLVYSLCNNKKNPADHMEQVKETIRKVYPAALAVIKNRELLLLLTDADTQEGIGRVVGRIRAELSDSNVVFGISNKFLQLNKTHIYLQQAKYAWSSAMEEKSDYMEYRDCILQNMISSVYSTLPRRSYEHDAVAKIREYDQKYNTEYLKTLSAYVESLFHAKETVQKLHVHRNTLPHRLEMIEKIGQLDLHDPKTCIVLMMNHYMNLY